MPSDNSGVVETLESSKRLMLAVKQSFTRCAQLSCHATLLELLRVFKEIFVQYAGILQAKASISRLCSCKAHTPLV
jgi:hypothetical protein